MTIGEKFIDYRAKKKMSQKQLAKLLEIGTHTVQRAENGKSMHKANEKRLEILFDELVKNDH